MARDLSAGKDTVYAWVADKGPPGRRLGRSRRPHWSDSTVARPRSAVFSMLAEAGYLEDARSLLLQNVFIDAQLCSDLRERGEAYVLGCLEVSA